MIKIVTFERMTITFNKKSKNYVIYYQLRGILYGFLWNKKYFTTIK